MLKAMNPTSTVDRTRLAEGGYLASQPGGQGSVLWIYSLCNWDTSRCLSCSDARAFRSNKSDDCETVVSCTAICCQDDKGQKVQTGQRRRPGKKHWAIPALCGAELGHVTPLLGSPQSSRTSIAHNCNFKPQEETKLPQTFILLRKWTILNKSV